MMDDDGPRPPIFTAYPETERVEDPQMRLGRAIWVGLTALGLQGAQWAALVCSFVLFGAAVWWPDWTRLVAAATFTALIYCPLWFRGPRASR